VSTADFARGIEDQSSGKFTLHHLFGGQAAPPNLDAAINHRRAKSNPQGLKPVAILAAFMPGLKPRPTAWTCQAKLILRS